VIESGQAEIVDGEAAVGDRLMLHPTPGQTIGHVAIELRSGEHGAVFSGDIMHQPLQVFRPDWNSAFCKNPVRAADSRRWLLEHAAETRSTAFTAHFENLGTTKVSRAELSALRIGEAYLCRGFNSRNVGFGIKTFPLRPCRDVRFWGERAEKHLIALSHSQFDPQPASN
jgi:glyoxylase-like metal-dependent hydrolase (beta-lactamase superfamily II)